MPEQWGFCVITGQEEVVDLLYVRPGFSASGPESRALAVREITGGTPEGPVSPTQLIAALIYTGWEPLGTATQGENFVYSFRKQF